MSYLVDYTKALKVIRSVKVEPQLTGASNYINLFIRKWSAKSFSKIGDQPYIISISDMVASMYKELNKQLDIKKNEIARKTN